MIKKIENGDVSQVSGGLIRAVLRLRGKGKKSKAEVREGANFLVVDPEQKMKWMVPRVLTAEEAIEAEGLIFGDKANTTQYLALTGKMVDFPN